jgi:tetratricopeptide (TPR) repeat protein
LTLKSESVILIELFAGRGSVWLERLLWEQEVDSSSLSAPTKIKINSSEGGLKMMSLRIWGIVLVGLSVAVTSYAGEMVQEQAVRYYNEGVRAQKSGDLDAAKTAYQKAIMLSEGARKDVLKASYNNVGVIAVNKENLTSAAQAFNEALSIDQYYKEANFNIAILYLKVGNTEKAMEYLSKALNKNNCYMLEGEKPE